MTSVTFDIVTIVVNGRYYNLMQKMVQYGTENASIETGQNMCFMLVHRSVYSTPSYLYQAVIQPLYLRVPLPLQIGTFMHVVSNRGYTLWKYAIAFELQHCLPLTVRQYMEPASAKSL